MSSTIGDIGKYKLYVLRNSYVILLLTNLNISADSLSTPLKLKLIQNNDKILNSMELI